MPATHERGCVVAPLPHFTERPSRVSNTEVRGRAGCMLAAVPAVSNY